MSYRVISVVALLIQAIAAQNGGCTSVTVSDNGGPLAVRSFGPITPSGIALTSDLALAGELALSGALPFLSAVAFEGQYPTSGAAAVQYGCGDCVAITQEIGNPSENAGNSPLTQAGLSGCGARRN